MDVSIGELFIPGAIELVSGTIGVNSPFEIVVQYRYIGNSEFKFDTICALTDKEGNIVATAEFNMSNTGGTIKDTEGNLIAKYLSSYFMNDYTVTIYDNNICSDMSILMIVASYVSDYMADNG